MRRLLNRPPITAPTHLAPTSLCDGVTVMPTCVGGGLLAGSVGPPLGGGPGGGRRPERCARRSRRRHTDRAVGHRVAAFGGHGRRAVRRRRRWKAVGRSQVAPVAGRCRRRRIRHCPLRGGEATGHQQCATADQQPERSATAIGPPPQPGRRPRRAIAPDGDGDHRALIPVVVDLVIDVDRSVSNDLHRRVRCGTDERPRSRHVEVSVGVLDRSSTSPPPSRSTKLYAPVGRRGHGRTAPRRRSHQPWRRELAGALLDVERRTVPVSLEVERRRRSRLGARANAVDRLSSVTAVSGQPTARPRPASRPTRTTAAGRRWQRRALGG